MPKLKFMNINHFFEIYSSKLIYTTYSPNKIIRVIYERTYK